jgi:hypothetical protein
MDFWVKFNSIYGERKIVLDLSSIDRNGIFSSVYYFLANIEASLYDPTISFRKSGFLSTKLQRCKA